MNVEMNKLSSDTARLISSLQVITKVENVVKELVENALDAGATCVEVKFENYGLSKIEVRDNGSGIKSSDVEYAAQRHYTSKISSKEDLDSLESYGFRGEALSSLCDVAEVFITTRTKDDMFSTKYSFNHKGFVISTKPCHLVQGTTVTANNLFAKIPVRCQFYQTPSKRKQILKNAEDVLMAFALLHTEKRFSFIHNKCVVWQKPGCKDLRSNLENVLGSSVVSQMIQAEHTNEENQIELCASIPISQVTRHYRKINDRCFIYVNNRPVHDKEVEKIVKQHTGGPNSSNHSMKWPVAFLSINLPLDRVDSNIESDKSRVMISDKQLLLTAIDQMLSEVYSSIPEDDEMEKENQVQLECETSVPNRCNLNSKQVQNVVEQSFNAKEIIEARGKKIFEPAEATTSTSDWSRGHTVVSDNGEPVQPVRVLTSKQGKQGNSVPNRPQTVSHGEGSPRPDLNPSGDITQRQHLTEDNHTIDTTFEELFLTPSKPPDKNLKLRQACLNLGGMSTGRSVSPLRTPVRSPSTNSATRYSSKKRKASSPLCEDVRYASLITKWASEIGSKENSSPVLSEDEESVNYADGQEIELKFDFLKLKEELFYKEDYSYVEHDPYSAVGSLKDVKAGVLLDSKKRKLYLVNLLRLQEAKLFWSLMENHAIHTKELPSPIIVPISSLSVEERSGLEKLERSFPDVVNPDVECTDNRICKNGFKIQFVKNSDGTESLKVYEMADAVSYYNIDDLRSILWKVASCDTVSLSKLRPFKVMQNLQAEAVRMSYSLPVHSLILECSDGLEQHFSKDFEDWKCFHDKPIFYPIFNFQEHS